MRVMGPCHVKVMAMMLRMAKVMAAQPGAFLS